MEPLKAHSLLFKALFSLVLLVCSSNVLSKANQIKIHRKNVDSDVSLGGFGKLDIDEVGNLQLLEKVISQSVHLYVVPDRKLYTGVVYIRYETSHSARYVRFESDVHSLHSVHLHGDQHYENREELQFQKVSFTYYAERSNKLPFREGNHMLEIRFQSRIRDSKAIQIETNEVLFFVGMGVSQNLFPLLSSAQLSGSDVDMTIDLQGFYNLESHLTTRTSDSECHLNGCTRYYLSVPFGYLYRHNQIHIFRINVHYDKPQCFTIGKVILFATCNVISESDLEQILSILLRWETEFNLDWTSQQFTIFYQWQQDDSYREPHECSDIYILDREEYFYEIVKNFYLKHIQLCVDEHGHRKIDCDVETKSIPPIPEWFINLFNDFKQWNTPIRIDITHVTVDQVQQWTDVVRPPPSSNDWQSWFDSNILVVNVDLYEKNEDHKWIIISLNSIPKIPHGAVTVCLPAFPATRVLIEPLITTNIKRTEYIIDSSIQIPYEYEFTIVQPSPAYYIVNYSVPYLNMMNKNMQSSSGETTMKWENRVSIEQNMFLLAQMSSLSADVERYRALLKSTYTHETDYHVILDICANKYKTINGNAWIDDGKFGEIFGDSEITIQGEQTTIPKMCDMYRRSIERPE